MSSMPGPGGEDSTSTPYKYDIYVDPKVLEKAKPVKVAKVPGRNDPCSCGSGVKYKKCCGRNK